MASEDHYAHPWRFNWELAGVAGWLAAAALARGTATTWDLHPAPFQAFALLALGLALAWLPGAWRQGRRYRRLRPRPLAFLAPAALARRVARQPDALWLGWGFEWGAAQAQLTHDLLRAGPARCLRAAADSSGAAWLHGLGAAERELGLPLVHSEGHLLVVGTTGAGKTRLFDLLVTQAVLRGEAVVIVDPKGDRELMQAARRACVAAGDPARFVHFHPAFPDTSVRIDPLASFNRPTEVASRIAALIPGETGNDPFKAFGQMALSNLVQGLIAVGERPTLVVLRRYLEGGPDELVVRVLERYFERHLPDWQAQLPAGGRADSGARAGALARFYRTRVRPRQPSTVVDGVLGMLEHERTHFSKMVASLMPILNMLTAGDLGPLLSPDAAPADERRPLTAMSEILAAGRVVYLGLDALSDAMVGGAIGSILIADLAAVAGARYNFGQGLRPVSVFIDEAAEVVNDPFIQLLNKGRGAGLRLALATQTFADFAARTGSEAKARQILANLNSVIALRVLDAETQAYFCDSLPKVRLRTLLRAQGSATDAGNPLLFSGSLSERLTEEEGALFPPALLGSLPNLHYLARLAGGRVLKGRLPILAAGTAP